MKRMISALIGLFIMTAFTGCYKQIPKEVVVPVNVNIVDLNAASPSQEEADIIITTHVKKTSYLFSPRTAEIPYIFTILIDGNEIKESVKGVEEEESNVIEERGKGIHYVFKKRARLKPGRYEIALKTEDSRSAKIKIELKGGKVYTLQFNPVYGPAKFGRPKHFREGVVDYEVNWDEERY